MDLVLGTAAPHPYSLCGDPDDTRRWRFLVRRGSRDSGVSAYLHDQLRAGDTLRARGPRDRFPLATAGRRGDLDLHRQRFDNPAADGTGGSACELVLARQGRRVFVPPGTPLLRALLDAGVAVPWACGSGICGACVLPVLDGKIRHRDAVLTATEQGAGRLVVTCVSTAATETLVLDV